MATTLDTARSLLEDSRLQAAPPPVTEATVAEQRDPALGTPISLREAVPLRGLPAAPGRDDCARLGAAAAVLSGQCRALPAVSVREREGGADTGFDLVQDAVRPWAAGAAAAVLGFEGADASRFAALSAAAAGALDATLCPPRLETARTLESALAGMVRLASSRRRAAPDGPIGAVLKAAERAGSTDPEEDAVAVAVLLGACGVEAAVNLVGRAVEKLLDGPEGLTAVRGPEAAADAVEETLRVDPPVRVHRLFAHEALTAPNGARIAAGDEVVVLTDAVHRDPAVFDLPDSFVPGRSESALHVTLHPATPLGIIAPLVRRLAVTGLRGLADTVPRPYATGPVHHRPRSPVTRSIALFPWLWTGPGTGAAAVAAPPAPAEPSERLEAWM